MGSCVALNEARMPLTAEQQIVSSHVSRCIRGCEADATKPIASQQVRHDKSSVQQLPMPQVKLKDKTDMSDADRHMLLVHALYMTL